MKRTITLGCLLALATSASHAATVIGGSLTVYQSANGVVGTYRSNGSVALLTTKLFEDSPNVTPALLNNQTNNDGDTAALVSAGTAGGTPLVLRFNVTWPSPPPGITYGEYNYFLGTGAANGDKIPHVTMKYDPTSPGSNVILGFEDNIGGGDYDFDDFVVELSNVSVNLAPLIAIPGNSSTTTTVAAGETGALVHPGGNETNYGHIDNSGQLFSYGSVQNDGNITTSGSVFLDLDSELYNSLDAQLTVESGGTLGFLGSLLGTAGPILEGVGGIIGGAKAPHVTNDGTTTVKDGGVMSNDGVLDNNGTLHTESGGTLNNSGTLNNTGTLQNDGAVRNGGTYNNSGNTTGSGTYEQTGSESQTTVNGTFGGSNVNIGGGTLNGNGTITAPTTVGPGGTVAPGQSPGTLTIDNAFTLDHGTIAIELASKTVFDVLQVTDTATFIDGVVNFFFAFTPDVGDSFVWLTATGGTFYSNGPLEIHVFGGAGVDLSQLVFSLFDDGNSIALQASAAPVPLPGAAWLLLSGLGALGIRARRRRHS